MQRAGERPEDRNAGRHTIFCPKRGGIAADDQQQAVGREFSAGGEIEADAMQPPRVRGIIRIIKFHRRVGDAFQLDELFIARRRVITNFVDDHRPHPRPGVGRSQGVEDLRRILRLAGADDVAAKAHSVLRRAKTETIAVAGQVPVRVRRVEVNFFAVRIEPKAVRRARTGIEIVFREHDVAARGNDFRSGDAEFLRHGALVGQIPIADVHVGCVGIKKLDRVELRQVGVREDLVD